jgi:hypothetical protein
MKTGRKMGDGYVRSKIKIRGGKEEAEHVTEAAR